MSRTAVTQAHLDRAHSMVRALWPRPGGMPTRIMFLFGMEQAWAASYLAWVESLPLAGREEPT